MRRRRQAAELYNLEVSAEKHQLDIIKSKIDNLPSHVLCLHLCRLQAAAGDTTPTVSC